MVAQVSVLTGKQRQGIRLADFCSQESQGYMGKLGLEKQLNRLADVGLCVCLCCHYFICCHYGYLKSFVTLLILFSPLQRKLPALVSALEAFYSPHECLLIPSAFIGFVPSSSCLLYSPPCLFLTFVIF